MLREITKAIASFQNPINRAEMNFSIAKQFNLTHQPDRALPYIEQALHEIGLISIEDAAINDLFVVNNLKCKAAEQLAKAGLQSRSTAMLTEALRQADVFEDLETRDYALTAIPNSKYLGGIKPWMEFLEPLKA